MNEVVSFQTAILLRDAGFPQPYYVEHGQSWYSCNGSFFLIDKDIHKTGVRPSQWFACYPAFAPCAADILREIRRGYRAIVPHDVEEIAADWLLFNEP